MTFNRDFPFANESPGLFPNENHGNMGRLEDIFTSDHVFNTTSAANDGYHKIIHHETQPGSIAQNNADPSPAAIPNVGQQYSKIFNGDVVDVFNSARDGGLAPDRIREVMMSDYILSGTFTTSFAGYDVVTSTQLPLGSWGQVMVYTSVNAGGFIARYIAISPFYCDPANSQAYGNLAGYQNSTAGPPSTFTADFTGVVAGVALGGDRRLRFKTNIGSGIVFNYKIFVRPE